MVINGKERSRSKVKFARNNAGRYHEANPRPVPTNIINPMYKGDKLRKEFQLAPE